MLLMSSMLISMLISMLLKSSQEWTNWTMGDNGKIRFWQATWMTYHPNFCPLWRAKWANIPPKMGKMGYIPSKLGQKQGGWGICSLYSYINFRHFFVICPFPQNGGIVKESKVSHALDQVHFCILLMKRQSWSNEVGLAALEWCGPGIQMYHLERVVHWCD